MGTTWFRYELVVGTSWSGYELVLGTSWLGYELAWYDLVRVRVDWKPFQKYLVFHVQHFGLKLPISGLILTIFGENRQKCEN